MEALDMNFTQIQWHLKYQAIRIFRMAIVFIQILTRMKLLYDMRADHKKKEH